MSSLNRHAVATREDVGLSKAECLKVLLSWLSPLLRHRKSITPVCIQPAAWHRAKACHASSASLWLQRHFQRIAPEAELDTINAMYSQDSSERLLSGSPHFVLDAIDNLETKVASR